ncbi:MAG: hypothetical protein ABW352_11710 [Polyangiales bacterium]
MRRLLLLVPLVFAGCVGLFSHEVRTEVQLDRLRDDLRAVNAKLDNPPPVRRLAPATAAPVQLSPRTGRLSARALYAGGHVKLIGMPAKAPDEVVLSVRPIASLDQDCSVRLYRDGDRIAVGEHVRRSDHELLVSIPVEELGASERFSGTVCGQYFELDRAGRDTIASFAARFHERVDQLSASSSTSVARAR